MASQRVLDIGNCFADHSALQSLIGDHFDAEVVWAHSWSEAEQSLRTQPADLVLVNRILDQDGSLGLEVIERLKADDQLADIPVMMVTNFPDHQTQAVEAGALPGYGKRALHAPATLEKFRAVLG